MWDFHNKLNRGLPKAEKNARLALKRGFAPINKIFVWCQIGLENPNIYISGDLYKAKIKLIRVEADPNSDQVVSLPFNEPEYWSGLECRLTKSTFELQEQITALKAKIAILRPPQPQETQVDWSIKHIQLRWTTEQDKGILGIREYFDSIADNERLFLSQNFTFVHFNQYCPSQAHTYAPAEFCCVTFNLKNGLVWFGGSPIDPGTEKIWDWAIAKDQSRKFALPEPGYTYSKGLAYSVGEDRYEEIVKSIYQQASVFESQEIGELPPYRYILAMEDNMQTTMGCLAWLTAQTGANPRLRVLCMERFIGELFRTCQIRRFDGDFTSSSSSLPGPESQTSTLRHVSSMDYASRVLNEYSSLDNRLLLGCLWHQRDATHGSVGLCSVTLCKKWAYRTLAKALELLGRDDFKRFGKELTTPDIAPILWDEQDAAGLEARQRFGFFGKISSKRIAVLEKGFIFPNLLDELRTRLPNGLTRKPIQIIWPLDRCIEKDLNWSKNATFIVVDPQPQERAEKQAALQEQRRIEQEKFQARMAVKRKREDDGEESDLDYEIEW